MYIFRLPPVRYALWAADVVTAIIIVLYATKMSVTPAAWTAVHHQLRLPDYIGTEPFDEALRISGSLIIASIILLTIVRIVFVAGRSLGETEAGLADTIEEAIENFRWFVRRKEEKKRVALAPVFQYNETDEAILRLTTPEQRAEAVAKVVRNRHVDANSMAGLKWCVLEELARMSDDLSRRLSFITVEQPNSGIAVLQMSDGIGPSVSMHYEPIIEHLGGTVTSARMANWFVVIWDEPHTPYLIAQLRLYMRAADLIACDRAGKVADRLHDELAAEARLWSYKGYRVAGGDYGTTPEAIERAAMIECQQVLSAALLASTPEVVSL